MEDRLGETIERKTYEGILKIVHKRADGDLKKGSSAGIGEGLTD